MTAPAAEPRTSDRVLLELLDRVRNLTGRIDRLEKPRPADPASIHDAPRRKRRPADTVGPTDTPAAVPVPDARPAPAALPVPAPPANDSLLPNGFVLVDVLAALPIAVVALDAAGRVKVWNPAAAKLFGWNHVEVHGKGPPFVPPDRDAEHHRMMHQAKGGAAVPPTETVRRAKNGTRLTLVTAAAADADGGVVLTFRPPDPAPAPPALPVEAAPDPAAAVRLARQAERFGTLVSAVVHDFHEMLAVVRGHADLIADLRPGGPIRESAECVKGAVEQAARLAGRLTRLAEPRRGTCVPVDVNATLSGLTKLLRGMGGRGVRVQVRTPRDAGLILADPGDVERILVNLVTNARDAMPDGGTVGVRTAAVTVTAPRPGGPPPGRYTLLTVADTGTGIEDVLRGRVFEPHFTTKSGPGHGLGLGIIEETVERLGGHVEFDTDFELGTVFRVYLPAIPDAEPVPDAPPTAVLLDADPSFRVLAERILERSGFVVRVLPSAAAAKADRVPADVLVIDAATAGGVRGLLELRRAKPGVPLVAVSLDPLPDLGPGTATVRKPFRGAELLLGLRRAGGVAAG